MSLTSCESASTGTTDSSASKAVSLGGGGGGAIEKLYPVAMGYS